MLLTKKNSGTAGASSSPFVHSLRRGLTQALPTLDRRTFLRRSGLGVGVGLGIPFGLCAVSHRRIQERTSRTYN